MWLVTILGQRHCFGGGTCPSWWESLRPNVYTEPLKIKIIYKSKQLCYNFLTNWREKFRHFLSVLCCCVAQFLELCVTKLVSWKKAPPLPPFTPNCKAEVWKANSLLQLFWIIVRNGEKNCHRLLMDFLTLLIQHSECSQPQTFSLRLLRSSTICTSHHLGLKCTRNNLAQVVKWWIVLSARSRSSKGG